MQRMNEYEIYREKDNDCQKLGTPDSVISIYDRGCKRLESKPDELVVVALVGILEVVLVSLWEWNERMERNDGQSMRSYVEETIDEEEALMELELPLYQKSPTKQTMYERRRIYQQFRWVND